MVNYKLFVIRALELAPSNTLSFRALAFALPFYKKDVIIFLDEMIKEKLIKKDKDKNGNVCFTMVEKKNNTHKKVMGGKV